MRTEDVQGYKALWAVPSTNNVLSNGDNDNGKEKGEEKQGGRGRRTENLSPV